VHHAVMVIGVSKPGRALIEHQRGVVARWQMADRPSDLAAVDALVRSGRWQTLYRGVYTAYTGPPFRQSALWAAALRCGPQAALSHFTAAELDGLADDQRDQVHVTVPAQAQIRMSDRGHASGAPAIVVHRSARLPMTRHPARTPPRTRTEETVLDLVELAQSFDGAFHWLSAACGRRLVTPAQLRAAAGCRAKLRWRDDVLVAIEKSATELCRISNAAMCAGLSGRTGCPGPTGSAGDGKAGAPRTSTTCMKISD